MLMQKKRLMKFWKTKNKILTYKMKILMDQRLLIYGSGSRLKQEIQSFVKIH